MLSKVFLSLVLLYLGAAEADSLTPIDYLKNMRQAMHTLNYQGTVVFMESDVLDVVNYRHAASDSREQEQLFSLNSPLREVIREAGSVRCIFKDSGKKVVEHQSLNHSFLVDLPENIPALLENYQIESKGDEIVAMRSCRRIDIKPRDDYRYSWRFWVDNAVFLPLKIEMLDLNGKVLEQVMFTQLILPESIPFLTLGVSENIENGQHSQSQSSEQLPFVLRNIPAGFHKQFFTVKPLHDGTRRQVAHLLLSDGLAAVSIYLDNADGSLGNSQTHLGSVNSVTRLIDNKLIVVLGKVPAKTAVLIADGVELK